MKIAIKSLFLVFFIFLICACTRNSKVNPETVITFDRNDFKESKKLNVPDTIKIVEALNPLFYYVIRDSLILVSNRDDSQSFKCGLYSIDGRLKCQLAPKGNGPSEFVSAVIKIESNNTKTFFIEDPVQNKLWTYNVDSVLKYGDSYTPLLMNIPRTVISYCMYDDASFVGYNFWHLDDDKYNNNVSALAVYNKDESDNITSHKHEFKYFVANVTGALLFTSKNKKEIWAADLYRDKISIYDDNLQIKKVLLGPDQYKMKYIDVDQEGSRAVYFGRNNRFDAYRSYTFNNKHIYMLFLGINDAPYKSDNLSPVEVFKLDWSGNLLAVYKLDRYAYSISVDSDEKYLYATTCNSYNDIPDFVRYELLD